MEIDLLFNGIIMINFHQLKYIFILLFHLGCIQILITSRIQSPQLYIHL